MPGRLHRLSGIRRMCLRIAAVATCHQAFLLGAEEPPVTKAAVLESLQAHAPEWAARVKTTSPRLFFSDAEWPDVVKAIDTLPQSRRHLANDFFTAVDEIVQKPLPVYLPPEKIAGTRGDAPSLYAAQEELWQREVGDDIFALAVASRLKPDAAYRAKLHDLVMAALEFETWGRGTNPQMGPNADLAAGHIARGIALAYDWHRDVFTEADRLKIRETIAARVPALLQGLYGKAYWARLYDGNHNHVSVAALGFCGAAFYDELPDAPEWLAAARENFLHVARAMPADGGSVEGISYWAYALSYILQYIEATRPIIDSGDLYDTAFLRNASSYRLHSSTSDLDGSLMWGDSVPRDWTTPHAQVYRLASQYNEPSAAWFADHLPALRGNAGDRALALLWSRQAPEAASATQPLDAHLFASDIVTSRTGWTSGDYLLSVKSGYTNRNHSHLDAGALAIAFGNEWLLAAPGYGNGKSEGAFWAPVTRWNYFSNATESHSTLLINDANQRFDPAARGEIASFFSSPEWTVTSVDLTRAYQDVERVSREILHRRGEYILVFDSVETPRPTRVEWLAQLRGDVQSADGGGLLVKGKKGALRIAMIDPVLPFEPRQPKSPKVDVNTGSYRTFSTGQTGTRVFDVVLIQPFGLDSTAPRLLTAVQSESPEARRLEITGDHWKDTVLWRAAPGGMSLDFSPAKEGAGFWAWLGSLFSSSKPASVTVSARCVVARERGDKIESVLVLDATSLELPGLALRSASPRTALFRKTADGQWEVTADREISSDITVSSGGSLRVTPGRPMKGKVDERD